MARIGNIYDEGLEITQSLLDRFIADDLFLDVRDGDYFDRPINLKQPQKKRNMAIIKRLYELYMAGELYPAKYTNVLCVTVDHFRGMMKAVDPKVPKVKDIYPNEVNQTIKGVVKAKYGVDNVKQHPDFKIKAEETSLKKFGYRYAAQSPEIKAKFKETVTLRYGVDHPLKSKDVINKIKRTNLLKYGVECTLQAEDATRKKKATWLEKYGVDNPMRSPIVMQNMRKVMMARYGVDSAMKLPAIAAKARETAIARYGAPAWNYRNYKPHWMPYQQRFEKIEFLKKFVGPRNKEEIFNIRKFLTDNCSHAHKHDVLKTLGLLVGTNSSAAEEYVADCLDSIGVEYRRISRPEWMGNLELDFMIEDRSIAIEIDGVYWHSDRFKERDYHLIKHCRCRDNGIRLISLTEDMVSRPGLLNFLNTQMNPASVEPTHFREISNDEAGQFVMVHHIDNRIGSLNYGWFAGDDLISVGCMSRTGGNIVLHNLATRSYHRQTYRGILRDINEIHPHFEVILENSIYDIDLFDEMNYNIDELEPFALKFKRGTSERLNSHINDCECEDCSLYFNSGLIKFKVGESN